MEKTHKEKQSNNNNLTNEEAHDFVKSYLIFFLNGMY